MKKTELMRSFNENGIRIFLLSPLDEESDSPVNGKIPLNKFWQSTAIHTDEEMDDLCMITDIRNCGYGVICDNLLVVDIDARNGGVDSYAKLLEEFPTISGAGLIVETGSGGGSKHLYFKLSSDIRVSKNLKEYPGIDFKHSGLVVGPGSMHRSGRAYTVLSGSIEEIDEAPAALVELLKPQAYERVNHGGEEFTVDDFTLKDALGYVNCYDDYHEWINIGMAIHHATNGDGIDIWDEWSQRSAEYSERDVHYKWGGFGKGGGAHITAGTIFKLAGDNGWVRSQIGFDVEIPEAWLSWGKTQEAVTEEWVEPETIVDDEEDDERDPIDVDFAKIENCPVTLKEIDLRDPPGFVGSVTKWIDSQCINPRKYLSAIGAVYAISTIAGLRYMGGNNRRSRTNMLILGVADSATGKDAVLSAVRGLIFEAGMGATVYGQIKSDKEITVNLIEHQSANYLLDEIGERFAKVSNSRNNGATHLDGVIATFMEVYSKSGSYHIVGGDMQREIKREILHRIADNMKKVEENDDPDGVAARSIESLKNRLNNDGKLDKPFLSILGFTTPEQLREIMTINNVKTGFLGRALLCLEPDEFPIEREGHEIPDIPFNMKLKLKEMASGSATFRSGDRIESSNEAIPIPYTNEADELLRGFSRWQRNYARYMRQEHNSPFGPLYKRMAEKAQKISLTLGLDEGIVTAEHVRWAVAAAWMDAQSKIEMVSQWDKEYSKKINIKDIVFSEVKKRPNNTIGKLCSARCLRDEDRDKVKNALDALVREKRITVKKTKNKRNGSDVLKYQPV